MIPVAFTITPSGAVGRLEIDGQPYGDYAEAVYGEETSELSEGGPHLVIGLPVERFTPGPSGLVLWIGDRRYRVDLGTRRAPPGGTVGGEGDRKTGTLPVMVVIRVGDRQVVGRLVPSGEEPAPGPDD
ncbi:MAG TPA: hypothetical protein PLI31_03505 [Methanoregulaceae archaeon]|nr:hypothetical protein [Methanoregulaceae archaeon]